MKNKGTLEDTFFEAYTAHSDALFRYCFFKINDREKALDLVQDVFMKTWNYMRDGGHIDNIRAFLYTTARHNIIDEYRKRKFEDSLETLAEESGFEPISDEVPFLEHVDAERAVALIRDLPKAYSEAVFMRYIEDLSLKEIADITGDTENTIAVRVHRGLAKLQKLFNTP